MGSVTPIDKKRQLEQWTCGECGGNHWWAWSDGSVQCASCGTFMPGYEIVEIKDDDEGK